MNIGQRYWYFEGIATQHFNFSESRLLDINLVETIKATEISNKRVTNWNTVESSQITPKKVRRTNIPDFEPYDPDYKMESDYSPHSIQAIFKDAIPPNMVTPERARDNNMMTTS